jgi:START domain
MMMQLVAHAQPYRNAALKAPDSHMRSKESVQQSAQVSLPAVQCAPTLQSATYIANPYQIQLEALVKKGIYEGNESCPPQEWDNVFMSEEIKVYINKKNDNCVKLVCALKKSAATAFDLFYDICEQPLWANISDHTDIIQILDPYTRIIYVQLKALWPTTCRDIVFISHIHESSPGHYHIVSESIEYPSLPPKEGFIRMKINCVVQQFKPTLPDCCSFVQIVDVDPGGWIPKSLVRFCNPASTSLSN